MNEIFQIREESRYNLCYTSQFTIPPIHSVYNCRESVSYMGPKIWELIPHTFKQINSTVCFYHVTYAFQSESTLYSCLNVKELLARSRREI